MPRQTKAGNNIIKCAPSTSLPVDQTYLGLISRDTVRLFTRQNDHIKHVTHIKHVIPILNMLTHIKHVIGKLGSANFAIGGTKNILPLKIRKTLYNSIF